MHFFFLICTTFGEEKRSFCFLPPPFFSGWHLNILVYNLALHSSPLLPSFASHAQSHKLLKYSSSLLLPLQEEASFGGREGGREEEGIHQYFFLTSDGRSLLSCSTCTTVYTHTHASLPNISFFFSCSKQYHFSCKASTCSNNIFGYPFWEETLWRFSSLSLSTP